MLAKLTYFFLVFISCLYCCVCIKDYNNYTLLRSTPIEKSHLEFYVSVAERFEVDFWTPPISLLKEVDFIIKSEYGLTLLTEAYIIGLNITVVIDDIQSKFEAQRAKEYNRTKINSFTWKDYFKINDIYRWLEDLTTVNPTEMEIINIGKTNEHREIMAIRIVLNGSKIRSKVIIEGGIHGREWISPAFVTFMIDRVVHAHTTKNKKLRTIAKLYEWYFIPVANPDGYEYTHTEDRLWRKNRSRNPVDLNRNFGHRFGIVGVGTNRSSPSYCGPSAFSEKESEALSSFIMTKSEDLEYYFSFHSYSQAMIIPYASYKKHLENYADLKKICGTAATEMKKKYKSTYKIGNAYETLGYLTSGCSTDWVKYRYQVPYVLEFEIRDRSQLGFGLPPSEILPTCVETLDAVLTLLQPQTKKFRRWRELKFKKRSKSGSPIIMDKIAYVFCMLMFIKDRFD